ncbi:gamma carbonic anhydrase family protein [Actinomadura darangshiensis]|nr:gamma carbonic anhydrase family protein [Actinomadura darangshiensis]
MLVQRNDDRPEIHPDAWVAPTAHLVGNVTVGPGCVIDHGATIVSSGPPVHLDSGVAVMPGAVVRSVGGTHRPAFPVRIGADTLVGPLAALAGCTLGAACYVATGVMVFQGALVGDGTRLSAGSIVHVTTALPPNSRVGLRHYAVPRGDGTPVITADLAEARRLLAAAGFFTEVFGEDDPDLAALHRTATRTLRDEALTWTDTPL